MTLDLTRLHAERAVLWAIEEHRFRTLRRARLADVARRSGLAPGDARAILDGLIARGRVRPGLYDHLCFVDRHERPIPAAWRRGHPARTIA